MTDRLMLICDSCRHFQPPDAPGQVGSCGAYPSGIPLDPTDLHDEPRPDQADPAVLYELAPGREAYRDLFLRIRQRLRSNPGGSP